MGHGSCGRCIRQVLSSRGGHGRIHLAGSQGVANDGRPRQKAVRVGPVRQGARRERALGEGGRVRVGQGRVVEVGWVWAVQHAADVDGREHRGAGWQAGVSVRPRYGLLVQGRLWRKVPGRGAVAVRHGRLREGSLLRLRLRLLLSAGEHRKAGRFALGRRARGWHGDRGGCVRRRLWLVVVGVAVAAAVPAVSLIGWGAGQPFGPIWRHAVLH